MAAFLDTLAYSEIWRGALCMSMTNFDQAFTWLMGNE